jgi:hypothetical protein
LRRLETTAMRPSGLWRMTETRDLTVGEFTPAAARDARQSPSMLLGENAHVLRALRQGMVHMVEGQVDIRCTDGLGRLARWLRRPGTTGWSITARRARNRHLLDQYHG